MCFVSRHVDKLMSRKQNRIAVCMHRRKLYVRRENIYRKAHICIVRMLYKVHGGACSYAYARKNKKIKAMSHKQTDHGK